MRYYEVAIADRSYGGESYLTYSHEDNLEAGQIISVSLRSKEKIGFIIKEVKRPSYKVIEIKSIYKEIILPKETISFFQSTKSYYPGSVGSIASSFVPKLPKKLKTEIEINQKNVVEKNNSSLTANIHQQKIIDSILSSKTQTHIIHGDTGTGKSLIYFELAKQMNNKNKSSIILTPEISLTPQISEQFLSEFKDTYIIHSALTEKEKRDIWVKILLSNEPVVVIGARSAIFAPVKNLGLLVIDEFHEEAYKQDQMPKYRTTRLAGILSKINCSKLVLGSATPPIDEYYMANSVGSEVHRLTAKPNNYSVDTDIQFVNLSDKNESTKFDLLTKTTIKEIEKTLSKKEQVLVFHNRRGTSRTIFCENCSFIETCKRCNIPYVYHSDKNILVCHTCNLKMKVPINCTNCGHPSIIFKNPGTKYIEDSLRKIFPNNKIARYDKDNKKNETFQQNYSEIKSGDIEILVGTQLLTKGHDLPKLGLAVNILANSSLSFPDYSSSEKNYQQLTQLLGRVGRHDKPGKAIIQYFAKPDKAMIEDEQKILTWSQFYDNEIKNRQRFNYPPFCYLLKIEIEKKSQQSAIEFSDKIASQIQKLNYAVEIIGPGPSLIEQKANMWHWQIIVKSKKRSDLIEIIKILPNGISYDLDPVNLL